MNNCLFCKIIANKIPASKIYEDDEFVVFLDIKPVNPGHCLIVPKEHYARLDITPDELAGNMTRLVPMLGKAIMRATGAGGFNLMVNNGTVAGQSIDHVHFHIIPRLEGDGYQVWHGDQQLSDAQALDMANGIRRYLQ